MENREDYRQVRKANSLLSIRALAVGYVLYLLYQIVSGYLKGGEGAPTLTVLILGVIFLGGGAVGLGVASYRIYRHAREQAKLPPKEPDPAAEDAAEPPKSDEAE